ncbi:uncharacterized protein L3040_002869 [Drepanopeziza brunnea f. sp. 'multigermtubi']|uniref:uncharacterized protein n=1 Tax=Drepanopeziza brunnea f. sp. 'multigermtubi' TaxID=698441 RepID=UPI002395ED22|nr:hypothetical protein L3040_002869 [Drepanopeziza brunnea f. sp. 'multigermtubi']
MVEMRPTPPSTPCSPSPEATWASLPPPTPPDSPTIPVPKFTSGQPSALLPSQLPGVSRRKQRSNTCPRFTLFPTVPSPDRGRLGADAEPTEGEEEAALSLWPSPPSPPPGPPPELPPGQELSIKEHSIRIRERMMMIYASDNESESEVPEPAAVDDRRMANWWFFFCFR